MNANAAAFDLFATAAAVSVETRSVARKGRSKGKGSRGRQENVRGPAVVVVNDRPASGLVALPELRHNGRTIRPRELVRLHGEPRKHFYRVWRITDNGRRAPYLDLYGPLDAYGMPARRGAHREMPSYRSVDPSAVHSKPRV